MSANLSPSFLASWMYEHPNIWQMDFHNSNQFMSFVSNYGLDSIGEKIKGLWHVGLLKADYVVTDQELKIDGLLLLGESELGQYWYADQRTLQYPNGLSNILKGIDELPSGVELYFHPFRYVVYMFLIGRLRLSISPIQEVLYSAGYARMLERWQEGFADYTSSDKFLEDLHYHEQVAALCIATEPCTYTYLFATSRRPWNVDEATQEQQERQYLTHLMAHYKSLGIERIEKVRQGLCIAAEKLDPNKNVHTILRLTGGETRIKHVKGKLGGAIYLLTMAEMLRRFAEATFEVQLPEEDELGFGYAPIDLKESSYNANRLLDGNRRSANLFLREWGLDYGVRLRWYVEGDTELGALDWLFGNNHSIELINLRGQVAEKRGKGVTFRENLRNDLRSQTFSFVSIDQDVSDNLRAVCKSAEDDEICGGFFVSAPNFEEKNFTKTELAAILWKVALESGVEPEQRVSFDGATKHAKSVTELIKSAQSTFPVLNQTGKGQEWGAKLMKYAWYNQEFETDSGEQKTRPIIEAALAALRADDANYLYTRRDYRVDPQTGELVKRVSVA